MKSYYNIQIHLSVFYAKRPLHAPEEERAALDRTLLAAKAETLIK